MLRRKSVKTLTKRTLKYMGIKANPNLSEMIAALEDFYKAGELFEEAYKRFQQTYRILGQGEDGKVTAETFIANAGGRENADIINNFNRDFWEWWHGQYGENYFSISKDLANRLRKV